MCSRQRSCQFYATSNQVSADGEPLILSGALDQAAQNGRYLANAIQGRRYDIDNRYGILMAQLALALEGKHREEVLAGIIELLAQ